MALEMQYREALNGVIAAVLDAALGYRYSNDRARSRAIEYLDSIGIRFDELLTKEAADLANEMYRRFVFCYQEEYRHGHKERRATR